MEIKDNRTQEEVEKTIGFMVATDKFFSSWGRAKGGRSIIACPVVSSEDCDIVEKNFHRRKELIRVRYVSGKHYSPKLGAGDHLEISDTKTSFRN